MHWSRIPPASASRSSRSPRSAPPPQPQTPAPALRHGVERQVEPVREDLHAPGGAEAALAPPHAGAAPELDPVERDSAVVDRLLDLRLGHALAAAHHPGEAGGPRGEG